MSENTVLYNRTNERKTMQISKRLQTVASFVTDGNSVADIGTDHAYVPILLAKERKITKALAMDINKGPLERAEAHIKEQGLSDIIQTRLSDGLSAFQRGEADTIIIAGMGGALTQKILEGGREVLLGVKEFILSPQSELSHFRHFLQESGYEIVKETMLKEDEKYYTIIKAIFGQMNYTKEVEFAYGKLLLEEKNSVLKDYLQKEKKTYRKIAEQLQSAASKEQEKRKKEILHKEELLQEAQQYYEM